MLNLPGCSTDVSRVSQNHDDDTLERPESPDSDVTEPLNIDTAVGDIANLNDFTADAGSANVLTEPEDGVETPAKKSPADESCLPAKSSCDNESEGTATEAPIEGKFNSR